MVDTDLTIAQMKLEVFQYGFFNVLVSSIYE